MSGKQEENKNIVCEQFNSPIQAKPNTPCDSFILKDDTSPIQVLEIPKKTCYGRQDASKKVNVLPAHILSMITKHVQENQKKISKQIQSSSLKRLKQTSDKKGNKKKQKKMQQQLKDSETQDFQGQASKTRPNYFIAVQIPNPQIALVAKELQRHIQNASSANYSAAFIGPEKFHITLMVLHLADLGDVQRAINSLDKCVSSLASIGLDTSVAIDFEGLGQFGGGRVLYAEIKESKGKEALLQIADQVSKHMNEVELRSTDSRELQPHLTLLKFNRHPQLVKQKLKKVEASLYQPYIDKQFGTQTVCSLQLCQMDKKREDGYYFVKHESWFASQDCESGDKQ